MRLIDADALKRKAQREATEAWKMKIKASVETVLNQFIDWIDWAPTIEPERKKGKWVKMSDRDGIYWACSECGKDIPRVSHFDPQFDLFPRLESIDKTNFCPNCGADMRGNNRETN